MAHRGALLRERLGQAWRHLLPDPGDRRAAAGFLTLALGPVALTLVLGLVPGTVAAQLTWSLRAGSWPYATEGPALSRPDRSWYRTAPPEPLDPWGSPYFVEDKSDDDTRVCSAGRNRVFELGEGDDVEVAGFFFLGAAQLLGLLMVLGGLSGAGGALLYAAWRQARLPRSPRVEVELARSAVISLPVLLACLCPLFSFGLHRVAEQTTQAWVSPRLALLGTVAFTVYLGVLYLRVRRPDPSPDDA